MRLVALQIGQGDRAGVRIAGVQPVDQCLTKRAAMQGGRAFGGDQAEAFGVIALD